MFSKYEKLRKYLSDLKKVAIAFSSGVDSTFLLKVAKDVLKEKVIAITVESSLIPQGEIDSAANFCRENNIMHYEINFDINDIKGFCDNTEMRCYICKKNMLTKVKEFAKTKGIEHILEGSNYDDTKDYRPGMRAVKELGVLSPLQYVELTKSEIRSLSKMLNLNTFNKPSFACLASRIPYREEITNKKLIMIEKAEQYLRGLGFSQYRVRIQDRLARIEVLPDEFSRLIEDNIREKIINKFYEYGFLYVSMDLEGYRVGSLNKLLTDSNSQVVR